MEKKIYQVFSLDMSFQPFETEEHLIGAESAADLIEHLHDVFPDQTYIVEREDWMEDEDWEEVLEVEECEPGTEKVLPGISEKKEAEIRESMEGHFPRVKLVEGLFSDKKYVILYTDYHVE